MTTGMIHLLSDELSECRDRLRKIVIHSADVLPEEVSICLKEVAQYGYWDAKKAVLAEYRPLVDYLPKEYVDFALNVLIPHPRPRHDTSPRRRTYEREDLLGKLGIQDHMQFFPPSHIQGPFLYLLHMHEEEGLRLIHTLVNTAVQRWCQREQNPPYDDDGRTPLPVMINLPSGPQEFWGNEQVYYWYRPNSSGPNAVVCALMALEVWMEQQVEAGRDPEGLFQQVLTGSHYVAVLGVCLGIALAYPEKCLQGALPLVSSSAIWHMDVRRVVADLSGSSNFDPFGHHQHIYALQAERDKRPQRSQDVRSLAMYYVLTAEEALRVAFEQAVSRFTEDLPFLYQEEQEIPEAIAYLREEMENFQLWGDRANYRQHQTDNGVQIWVEPPEHIKIRNEAKIARNNVPLRWFGVSMWAQKTMEEGQAANGMTFEEAVAAAQAFQHPGDFSLPYGHGGDPETWRLQAIAGVAAAVLLTSYEWAQERGYLSWCRDILLAAACLPSQESDMHNRHTIFPADPRVSAGRGLGVLVGRGVADAQVREQVLQLVADSQLQVMGAVFRGLGVAWAVDEVLCWNALSLGLSLCLVPKNLWRYSADRDTQYTQWTRQLVQEYINNVKSDTIPQLPRIPVTEDIVFLWDTVQRPLCALPFSLFMENPATKGQILQLTDDLMTWTVQENTPAPNDPHGYHTNRPFEWNHFFMKWVSSLTESLPLEEARQHVLTPIRLSWPHAPGLTAELLEGYISYHIGFMEPPSPDAQIPWREICNWVLDSPEIAREAHYDFLTNDIADAVSLIVYTGYGVSRLKAEWPHAVLFADINEKWIEKIGHNPSAYSYLITMLNGPGWVFSPEPALEWLHRIVKASSNVQKLLGKNSNGERTAELLMRMWDNVRDNLCNNTSHR
jgi:hypothetical protein